MVRYSTFCLFQSNRPLFWMIQITKCTEDHLIKCLDEWCNVFNHYFFKQLCTQNILFLTILACLLHNNFFTLCWCSLVNFSHSCRLVSKCLLTVHSYIFKFSFIISMLYTYSFQFYTFEIWFFKNYFSNFALTKIWHHFFQISLGKFK